MKNLIGNRFVVKSNSFIVDLRDVDFITYKENENEAGTYWIKFHIGTKEARFICHSTGNLRDLIQVWALNKDSKARIEEDRLV